MTKRKGRNERERNYPLLPRQRRAEVRHNTEFDAMDDTDRGTLLANLTISLFRTCERDLTEESLDRLLDEIERDEPAEALH